MTERISECDRRKWFGPRALTEADANYYALHFRGHLSVTTTNRLLIRFQTAERVIHWAQTKPDRDVGGRRDDRCEDCGAFGGRHPLAAQPRLACASSATVPRAKDYLGTPPTS